MVKTNKSYQTFKFYLFKEEMFVQRLLNLLVREGFHSRTVYYAENITQELVNNTANKEKLLNSTQTPIIHISTFSMGIQFLYIMTHSIKGNH